MALAVTFWIAVAVVAYAWVGYPLAAAAASAVLARRRRGGAGVGRHGSRPRVSIVVAAYNEAAVIAAKIRSALGQRYPADRLEVIVVSDGSTDATDAIVAATGDRRVRLLRQEPRAGKSAALNRGVAAARGGVLVFTDANALFAPDALARLAAPFADPRVGLVSGQGLYAERGNEDAAATGGGYVRYEAFVKSREAALGFVAGADGAIYALRRSLYRDLGPAEINDLLHPMQAVLGGYLCRFEPGAVTMEPPSSGGAQEWQRHVRMAAQAMHLAHRWLPVLVAARRWGAVWMFVSHRVVRWFTAPLLLAALAASAGLLDRAPYRALVAAQLAFYGLAVLGLVAERRGGRLGRLALPYYFCVVAAAAAAGAVRWLAGGVPVTWAPRGRAAGAEPVEEAPAA